ncbi:MAG TPA: double zinc ribbon domain-containing protein, partial [Vicinamibacteria bacterium]|nr:double zinc ribbon domain-containing protein [Vicinamibacteria bacterium]
MSSGLAAAPAAAWRLVDPVLALVFPSRCPCCERMLRHPSRGPLCESCWTSLPRHRLPLCACGLPLAVESPRGCGRCRRGLNPARAG